jgi:hypothetical protein
MSVLTVCFTFDLRGSFCGGQVTWTRDDGGDWHGRCGRCHASGRAASGERAALEKAKAA